MKFDLIEFAMYVMVILALIFWAIVIFIVVASLLGRG